MKNPSVRLFDGVDIHPNAEGYAAMAAAVRDVLRRM